MHDPGWEIDMAEAKQNVGKCGGCMYIYIYIPGTQLTSIFEGQPSKTMTLSIKARAIWVLGIYIYIYSAFPRARSASSVFALYSGSNAGQAWPRQRRQNVTKTEPNAQLKIFNITPFQYTWCKALRCFFQTKAVFF